MLSPADLAAMRQTVQDSLPDTAQIRRRQLVPDGALGFTENWTVVATVPCRVAPGSAEDAERAGIARTGAAVAWAITVPAATEVLPADRVTVGSRTFQVATVLAPRSYELGRRVLATEV
jgi:head-tail adaptor